MLLHNKNTDESTGDRSGFGAALLLLAICGMLSLAAESNSALAGWTGVSLPYIFGLVFLRTRIAIILGVSLSLFIAFVADDPWEGVRRFLQLLVIIAPLNIRRLPSPVVLHTLSLGLWSGVGLTYHPEILPTTNPTSSVVLFLIESYLVPLFHFLQATVAFKSDEFRPTQTISERVFFTNLVFISMLLGLLLFGTGIFLADREHAISLGDALIQSGQIITGLFIGLAGISLGAGAALGGTISTFNAILSRVFSDDEQTEEDRLLISQLEDAAIVARHVANSFQGVHTQLKAADAELETTKHRLKTLEQYTSCAEHCALRVDSSGVPLESPTALIAMLDGEDFNSDHLRGGKDTVPTQPIHSLLGDSPYATEVRTLLADSHFQPALKTLASRSNGVFFFELSLYPLDPDSPSETSERILSVRRLRDFREIVSTAFFPTRFEINEDRVISYVEQIEAQLTRILLSLKNLCATKTEHWPKESQDAATESTNKTINDNKITDDQITAQSFPDQKITEITHNLEETIAAAQTTYQLLPGAEEQAGRPTRIRVIPFLTWLSHQLTTHCPGPILTIKAPIDHPPTTDSTHSEEFELWMNDHDAADLYRRVLSFGVALQRTVFTGDASSFDSPPIIVAYEVEQIAEDISTVIHGPQSGQYHRITFSHPRRCLKERAVDSDLELLSKTRHSPEAALHVLTKLVTRLGGFSSARSSNTRGTEVTLYIPSGDTPIRSRQRRMTSIVNKIAMTNLETPISLLSLGDCQTEVERICTILTRSNVKFESFDLAKSRTRKFTINSATGIGFDNLAQPTEEDTNTPNWIDAAAQSGLIILIAKTSEEKILQMASEIDRHNTQAKKILLNTDPDQSFTFSSNWDQLPTYSTDLKIAELLDLSLVNSRSNVLPTGKIKV